MEAQIKRKREELSAKRMLKEEVGPEEVAAIVSKWTGIPVSKLQEEDRVKLLRLSEELHRRVVGQDEAVSAVATAVLRSRCLPQEFCQIYHSCRYVGCFVGESGIVLAMVSDIRGYHQEKESRKRRWRRQII